MLQRRGFLKLAAGGLVAGRYWPGVVQARAIRSECFRFAVINDLHYHDKKCSPWFVRLVEKLNSLQPELVLILGDLVEMGTRQEHQEMADHLRVLKMPWYVVPGNHDYISDTDRLSYDSLHAGRSNYLVEQGGWQFVGLDTTGGRQSRGVRVSAETLRWLDQHLPKMNKNKPTAIFTHFPLLFGVPFILKDARPILERFVDFNLQHVFSGHWHGFTELKRLPIIYTTGKCCSYRRENHDHTPEKGFFLCEAADGKLTREFIRMQ